MPPVRETCDKHFRKFRPLISAVGEERLQKWKRAGQCRHDESASIATLNVGQMNDGVDLGQASGGPLGAVGAGI